MAEIARVPRVLPPAAVKATGRDLPPDEQLWRPSDVAVRLRVTQAQVRKWISAGIVHDVRVLPSGQYRIPETSVQKLVQQVMR